MTTTSTPDRKERAAESLKTNEQKWSKPLMDAGWTAFPSVLIERQLALGLDALDINILLHLAAYWWTADNRPHPSKTTIATAMKVNPRTVQRRIAEMEKAGFIKREERRIAGKGSKPNIYHLDGLIESAKPYAEEKIKDIAERAEEKKARAIRKRAKLRIVSSKEEEEE